MISVIGVGQLKFQKKCEKKLQKVKVGLFKNQSTIWVFLLLMQGLAGFILLLLDNFQKLVWWREYKLDFHQSLTSFHVHPLQTKKKKLINREKRSHAFFISKMHRKLINNNPNNNIHSQVLDLNLQSRNRRSYNFVVFALAQSPPLRAPN